MAPERQELRFSALHAQDVRELLRTRGIAFSERTGPGWPFVADVIFKLQCRREQVAGLRESLAAWRLDRQASDAW